MNLQAHLKGVTVNTKSQAEASEFLTRILISFKDQPIPGKKCDMVAFTQLNCCDLHREERTIQNALSQESATFGVKTKAKFGTKAWMNQFMQQYGLGWPSETNAALMADGNDY